MTTPITEPVEEQPDKEKEVKSTKPVEQKKVILPPEPTYKLDIYIGGGLKPSVRTEVMLTMSRKYGDIMRAISPDKWMTMTEICDSTWQVQEKLRISHRRIRKEIESAVSELVEAQFVLKN